MIRLKVGDNKTLIILDPGNIRRMKELQPLVIPTAGIAEVAIVITPDIIELNKRLKFPVSDVDLNNVLNSCKDLPEAEQPMIVDGNERLTH